MRVGEVGMTGSSSRGPAAVAVAQLINKTGQEVDVGFTREDEEIMEYFAMFAGPGNRLRGDV